MYHETSEYQLEDGIKLLEIISPGPNEKVLDIGCSTGRLSKVISERVGNGGKVIGVDPDEERIKIALKAKGCNNIHFMVESDQTFPKDKYDAIVSTDVFHWIKDKESLFKRIYDNLKPGGKLGFTTFDGNGSPDLLIEIFRLCGPKTYEAALSCIYFETGQKYKELATAIGFDVMLLDIKARKNTFPNIDAFINFFYAVYYGMFDRDDPGLNDLRERYKGQPVPMELQRLTMILTKPLD